MTAPPNHFLSRRRLIALAGAAGASCLLVSCGGDDNESVTTGDHAAGHQESADFAARFAGLEPAEEPEGDLDTVTWPAFVTASPPEVRELYEFHVTNGELMRYIPCFCGCNAGSGHLNNRDCYSGLSTRTGRSPSTRWHPPEASVSGSRVT